MKIAFVFSFLCLTSFADLRLIGGTPADPKVWPSSVYASMSGARCSATVVGDRVLLIASHCVSNGGTASFSVGPNSYKSVCTHHPEYRGNSTADWTLCLVDRPVVGAAHELLNLDPSRVKVGDTLTLTGYGCIRPGGGGGNDGTFRVGTAPVRSLPSGRNYDIVTRGKAALCYGDSGGAAYATDGAARWIVGVNSRGDISTTSYLPALHAAKTFLQSWSQKNKVEICGLTNTAKGCRSVDVVPDKENPCE